VGKAGLLPLFGLIVNGQSTSQKRRRLRASLLPLSFCLL
jgi:hypothetical protein